MGLESRGVQKQIVDELSKVLHDAEEAKTLVLRTGFPPADLPAFNTPRRFWNLVVSATVDGKLAGGIHTLVAEVMKQYPGNVFFLNYESNVGTSYCRNEDDALAAPGPSGMPPTHTVYAESRAEIVDKTPVSGSRLLIMEPTCEHVMDHQWRIRLRVAFRRHRIQTDPMMKANIAFAAAGAWILAEAESSEILECSAEPSPHSEITSTKTGSTRAEWSCDPGYHMGQRRGFLEGNETLFLTYQAKAPASLSTRGQTTGIVFVDASGNPIRGALKNMALRIRLWSLGREVSTPDTIEIETQHSIAITPENTP
jgi:hypothetical protein